MGRAASRRQPFLSYAFLSGLERSGSLRAEYGWRAHHLGLYKNGKLVAAAPLYLKRKFARRIRLRLVLASAYERVGLDYYPKLLGAVPYSPVNGARLLVGHVQMPPHCAARCSRRSSTKTRRSALSSAHINFVDADDAQALDQADDWIARFDWQFHWTNRNWKTFDGFLAALDPQEAQKHSPRARTGRARRNRLRTTSR